MGDARRNINAAMVVGSVGLGANVNNFSRTVGCRTGAEVVKHYSSASERYIPIVGLVKVIVEPHYRSGSPIAAITLDHFASAWEPLSTVSLDEYSALIAMDVGFDDNDAVDGGGGDYFGHRRFLTQFNVGMISQH
ncbi:unannotated protein [freshwater metagenome]|uniref:Unannotated protein n=1 Tax=freshwater metagenome TaxID=449393 RepID=A0A6J7RWP7_9ZZZZ